MLLSIKPDIPENKLHDIFVNFDPLDIKEVKLSECKAKLCKMMQVPNISDTGLRESIKKIKMNNNKKSL